ncbi:MAG: hypothetical protein WCE64_14445, partial [Bacteroidales bacterium]
MKKSGKIVAFTVILIGYTLVTDAQEGSRGSAAMKNDTAFAELRKPQKVVTSGSVTIGGKLINYKAVAGTIVLKDE